MHQMFMKVKPLGWFERILDACFKPVMRFVSGAPQESPQRTHRWNYHRLPACGIPGLTEKLHQAGMVREPGRPHQSPRYWFGLPIMHLPILGGWKQYVVLEAPGTHLWYVGWWMPGFSGVSRLPIRGRVRMLLGPGTVWFFALDGNGHQLPLQVVGYGRIGDGGPFCQEPLH